ncbi:MULTISPECIES: CsgE family curli-type amyloid fiber assembly protein [Reichenbachiella]|uniref:Curli production assembly/transport component CsgE n=1 Tax=Reichenbachiella agariperforans TaxID=156994 RepID=A0A1M6LE56_REIAG|nr:MULTISPECIES: CsgE family curli-type amyloid fiber assembly protein [Reichenbachiella]MBU2913892.1 curli production assembly/transport protein CsgE [Reichenbachiella agariperforans]RJE74193.1 hypothetical protein BGP76_13465 [Reichenbachiella sp. MSK19-1]SHJ69484.1 curli production assembly/transport component CsgE [Reichenbachiella agariperforans]
MKNIIKIHVSVFLIGFFFNAQGQAQDVFSESVLIEIDQLIVDETLSKSGRDFYDMFYTNWNWPDVEDSFIIHIKERPARSNSTQVQVYVNELLVFESFLQPRHDFLVELSDQASYNAYNYVIQYREVLEQLEGDDMTGTGLF